MLKNWFFCGLKMILVIMFEGWVFVLGGRCVGCEGSGSFVESVILNCLKFLRFVIINL